MADKQEIIECPLKVGKTSFTDCTGSKCGFWSKTNSMCSVAVLGDEFSNLVFVLENGIRVRNI